VLYAKGDISLAPTGAKESNTTQTSRPIGFSPEETKQRKKEGTI